MTRKQSRSSKRSQTEKAISQTPSQPQQSKQEIQAATPNLAEVLSKLSDDQLNQAISTGYQLAMLDSLSMLQRKAASLRKSQSQLSMSSTSQEA